VIWRSQGGWDGGWMDCVALALGQHPVGNFSTARSALTQLRALQVPSPPFKTGHEARLCCSSTFLLGWIYARWCQKQPVCCCWGLAFFLAVFVSEGKPSSRDGTGQRQVSCVCSFFSREEECSFFSPRELKRALVSDRRESRRRLFSS